jgi:excisionase family DNA binding protein
LDDEILTLTEVAKILRLGPKTVVRLSKERKIPAEKVGRSWRYRKSEILKFLQEKSDGS